MTKPSLPQTWSRAVILDVRPNVDNGRYPVKRVTGESVQVTADIVADGHDVVAAEVHYGAKGSSLATQRLSFSGNDTYEGEFYIGDIGLWVYQVQAWVDAFATWRDVFKRRVETGSPESELQSELLEGAELLEKTIKQAKGDDKKALRAYLERFERGDAQAALENNLAILALTYDPREGAAQSQLYEVLVEPPLAQFSSWYEFFPRSLGEGSAHGTLDDAAAHLDYVKEMKFDIAYLPPIHPIGKSFRKGKDNAPHASEDDPGSPWAIGSDDGGHKSVQPELGGMDAFERFMARAKALDIEVALDLAYQCSPDHPWVKEHPSWFRQRSDGSIRYAENPPKKYQDIYPIDFESKDWKNLWQELKSVITFWAERGVRVFRVDNPHTKAIPFWEWCFKSVREDYPDVIFLAEAFTRPKQMQTLAKVGFSQSYSYFTWRYTKREFSEYLQELFQTPLVDVMRPNFWPNTPDILPPYLRERATFQARLVMAATMSSCYGVYGPAFELMDNVPHETREEYKNNEKYELKTWNLGDSTSLKGLMAQVNEIRLENPALRNNRSLLLHGVNNDQLLAYSKQDGDNRILVIVSFDPYNTQSGFTDLDLNGLGLPTDEAYMVEDLLTGERYTWRGAYNYVELNPHHMPAHIFRLSGRSAAWAARQRAI